MRRLTFILISLLLFCACPQEQSDNTKTNKTNEQVAQVLRLGMVPFETGEELLKDMQPLN